MLLDKIAEINGILAKQKEKTGETESYLFWARVADVMKFAWDYLHDLQWIMRKNQMLEAENKWLRDWNVQLSKRLEVFEMVREMKLTGQFDQTVKRVDEMLAARLGLIPLKMDSKTYKRGDKVKLVLEKEGPATVYSKDIKSTDPKIDVAELNIPITKLAENQKIKLEMDAIVGCGKEHCKWQPAIASYIELPTIKGEKGKTSTEVIEIILDENQRDIILEKGQKIEYDPTSFIFTVESHGNLTPKELFIEATEELKLKTSEFRKELKNLS